jgi:hypothetical protein
MKEEETKDIYFLLPFKRNNFSDEAMEQQHSLKNVNSC